MKALGKGAGLAAAVALAALAGRAYASVPASSGQSPKPILVSIGAIPAGTRHGVLTFSGINGTVTSAILREFGPGGTHGTAKPINTPGKGFTIDFKPPVTKATNTAAVCIDTSGTSHPKFLRGTWSGPAGAVAIKPATVDAGTICGE